ncbi:MULTISPECIES: RICIN domain-containing protein [Streptomyces]|uniref:RICIN domain-containing protein n=1 Tax=Streptomyces virginiae TaxID=1961 RepID=A0ABZ1T497_STRVG|nr:RICIN domain-containing protein [Streptomyces virginiae]WTB20287.1 RICIN domain-containing protein [Streptomyces virginiae]
MAPVPNGTYTITRPPEQLLTLLDGAPEPKTPVVLLPPTGNPGEQEWQLEKLSNGNYTIRNLRSETYVSYDGDPEMNKPVVGYPEPREWALYQSDQPHTFHVVVPGGPVDGEELALDLSLLRIFPPRIALRPLDVSNRRQAWTFQFME